MLFVLEAMRKSYDPLTNTAVDVTLDTSDLPLAPNFYHFCKYTVGEKIKMPFARQLWIGYRFFSEWCPRCSDPAYNEITRIEVDADPEEVLDHVTLLENGRCPKCNASKSQMVLSNELNDYNELDLVLGQRSGKSTLLSLMGAYHVHRLLKVPRLSSICNGIQDFTPIQGTFVGLSFARAKKLLWSPFTSIIERSTWFCLAEGTQVSLVEGTKSIEDIQVGDVVKTFEGQHAVARTFDNGLRECLTLTLEAGHTLTGTKDHQVQCLAPDGQSLIWKAMGDLTEDDFVVTE